MSGQFLSRFFGPSFRHPGYGKTSGGIVEDAPQIPIRPFLPGGFDRKEFDRLNKALFDHMRETTIKGSSAFFIKDFMKRFTVGQKVFSTVYGYGEVVNTDPETVDDHWPVEVVFKQGQGDDEHVEFYGQDGKESHVEKVTLFANKADALEYVKNIKDETLYSRVFNFYDDGKFTTHSDELSAIAGTTYEECHTSRKLVKRHRVAWGN
jgi:hypothetical protein